MNASIPIPWKTRPDLTTVDLGSVGRSQYSVKDQVANQFYRFGELEHFILQALRERVSMESLTTAISEQFAVTLSKEEIGNYLQQLVHDNLLISRNPGDGSRLYQQQLRHRSAQRRQRWMGLLSIRLPGFYPGPLLSILRPVGWALFHPVTVAMIVIATLITAGFALFTIDTLIPRLPTFTQLISPQHLMLMAVGFIAAKILHELGHGLACQRSGHDCSEMGVLFLVFMPCLYCDVSDLWTERSRAKRILVSLAGVLVELAIAVICFWGWTVTMDGTLHRFLFGMMLVTSVNTLFVNGNPLMRYDGYYALSDWVRIPNLAAASRAALTERFGSFFLNRSLRFRPDERTRFLLVYAVASFIYRWFIMFAIAAMIIAFFDSRQLVNLGWAAAALIIGLSLVPMLGQFKTAARAVRTEGLRTLNSVVVFGFLFLVGWIGWNLSFTHRVVGDADFQLADARHLFSPADGQLEPLKKDGDRVRQNETIAAVINDDLIVEAMTLRAEQKDVQIRLEALELTAITSETAAEIEFWKERQASGKRRLAENLDRQAAMKILAPIDGKIVAARRPIPVHESDSTQLDTFGGTVLDEKNAGAHVRRGENLCYVANPSKCRGLVRVDEREIEPVALGQEVRVFVPHEPEYLTGVVTRISLQSERDQDIERRDSSGDNAGDVSVNWFLVEFVIDGDAAVRPGSVHRTVVVCQETTVGEWLTRWWQNSVWF